MSASEELVTYLITDTDHQEFKRLDQLLASRTDYSRTFLKSLFESEMITATNEAVRLELKKMPPVGTTIEIEVPPPLPTHLIPEKIPLEILYEDEHILVVNKAAGMVTHPAPGNPSGTLANAVLYHCKEVSNVGESFRPGIVHRLDKGTSGVMVVAKDRKAHENLVVMFSQHDLERRYEAITINTPNLNAGKIESSIGRDPNHRQKMAANVKNGKKAITHYKVLKRYQRFSHLELRLETGRTHQIRVHLSKILQTPIFLDPLYGSPKDHLRRCPPTLYEEVSEYPHPFLHAKLLAFDHPITGVPLRFETKPPPLFEKVLLELEKLTLESL